MIRSPRQSLAARVWALRLAVASTVLVLAIGLALRAEPRDELRGADQLFAQGSYHAALQIYARLSSDPQDGEAALRLAAVRMVRGEYGLAERALRQAMGRGLPSERHDLALLYLGQALAAQGSSELAARTWHLLERCDAERPCPWRGPQRILMAEQALSRGDYASAEAGLRLALADSLPSAWRDLAVFRLTLLGAARDQTAALAALGQLQASSGPLSAHEPLLEPLLPTTAYSLDQLLAVLGDEEAVRGQGLGQIYLNMGLFSLAEAQFAQIDPGSPSALGASAYAAYTRWLAGDQQGGLERLEELVATYPDEPRARTLLALAYMATDRNEAAQAQINRASTLSPANPDTRLAWASWYAAQRDYVAAAEEYRLALVQAPTAEKGRYALLGANFHLDTAYEICAAGLPLAESAVLAMPNDPSALTTLAAQRYHCSNFVGAANVARRALAEAPRADAAYYLGAALAASGDERQARSELVRAADLAPASDWRVRAEAALARLARP